MDNIITGVIAVTMLVVFLGFYAYKIVSVPLLIILVGVLALAVYDFYDSVQKGESKNENGD
jgi:hypothetical protein